MSNSRKPRREWLVFLLVLPFGIAVMFCVGQAAISLPPTWSVQAEMDSYIDPNTFIPEDQGIIAPLRVEILTQPAWGDTFLTPGAVPETGDDTEIETVGTALATASPLATITQPATQLVTPTASLLPTNTAVPTSTTYYSPPTNTKTPPRSPADTPVPPVPSADLSIAKDDGVTTYTAGGSVTYIIDVANAGPSNVTGATITDNLPAQISSWSWVCTTMSNASGCDVVANSTTNFTDTVDIQSGGSIRYTVTANISGTATGSMTNTATISVPSGVSDPISGNNSSFDTDTYTVPIKSADLAITKTDSATTYAPNSGITYTIEVTNLGPDDASGFNITDTVPPEITISSVSCATSGTGTASCGTDNTVGNAIVFTGAAIDFVGGNKITITVIGTTGDKSNTGTLANTANIVIPGGTPFADPDIATNNSATDNNLPGVDVQVVAVDDGKSNFTAGDLLVYTVTINNAGPFDLTGVGVTSSIPAQVNNWTWSCASGCTGVTNSTANFSDSIDLNSGTSLTYTVTAVTQSGVSGTLDMTVNATTPVGFIDTTPSNNSLSDSDQQIYSGNIGSEPDGGTSNISSGSSVTLTMTVTVNGHSGWDLVYYELPNGCGITMDWVEIQVGDGSNWYSAFFWGDGSVDSNSNIASLGLPESDSRSICSADLYGATGVAIELDGVVPPGTYPYVKILAPAGDGDGIVEVDAVTPLPIP